jgi:hypothetical protein
VTAESGLPTLTGPWCYYIDPMQDPKAHGGFIPSVVEDGEPGHWPLLGRGECASPWVWGKTLAEAEAVCAQANEGIGVDRRTAAFIVLRSMGASNRGRRAPLKTRSLLR